MKYMYLADNQSLMTAGVFYYYQTTINNGYITSNEDFIVFDRNMDYNKELVDSLYNEEIVILGFIPDEKIVNSLLAKGNKVYHHIVLDEPKDIYPSNILLNKSYQNNVYYSSCFDTCNALHLWYSVFSSQKPPRVIRIMNEVFTANKLGNKASEEAMAVYSYIKTIDSSNPANFANIIQCDITRTISYCDMISTGNTIIAYMNEAITRGVVK